MSKFYMKDNVPYEYNPDWSWQENALEKRTAANSKDWIQEAGVGAGKSTFSAKCVKADIDAKISRAGIWFAPTVGILSGLVDAGHEVGLELTPDWNPNKSRILPDGFHGAVFTYQNAKDIVLSLRDFMVKNPTTSVCDEWHHIFEQEGEDSTWYDPISVVMGLSARTVRMSGTMFRTFGKPAGVKVDSDGFCISDDVFPYRMGIAADINRGISFPMFDRTITYERDDGSRYEHNFDSIKAKELANKILKNNLYEEKFVHEMLLCGKYELDEQWRKHSGGIPDVQYLNNLPIGRCHWPAGLVVAIDIDHAKWICGLLRKMGEDPLLVHSPRPGDIERNSHKQLRLFKYSERKWIVSVGMVTEGVNIPRICVGVWLSNITAPMKVIQAIGRAVRRIGPFDDMGAWLFPKDPRFGKVCKAFEDDHKFAMKEKEEGKDEKPSSPPTQKQIDAIKKLGYEGDMPKTKYQAQKLLDELTGKTKTQDRIVSDVFCHSETIFQGISIDGQEDALCRDYLKAKGSLMDPRMFYMQVGRLWSPEEKEIAKKLVEKWKEASRKQVQTTSDSTKSRYDRLIEAAVKVEELVGMLAYERLSPGEKRLPETEKKEVKVKQIININTFIKNKWGDRESIKNEGKLEVLEEIVKYLKSEINKNKKEDFHV